MNHECETCDGMGVLVESNETEGIIDCPDCIEISFKIQGEKNATKSF